MKDKIAIILIALVIILSSLGLMCYLNYKEDKIRTEILKNIEVKEVHDTISIPEIVILEKTKVLYQNKIDTLIIIKDSIINDTILIEIPIEHKEYKDTINKDSIIYNLRIGYSGYRSKIDYIDLTSRYTKLNIIILKEKKFNLYIGLFMNAGYGVNFNVVDKTFSTGPYIGIGISYGFGYKINK